MERRFLTVFVGEESRSRNFDCLLAFVNVLELLLLGMDAWRRGGDRNLTEVLSSSFVAVTKDAVPESAILWTK